MLGWILGKLFPTPKAKIGLLFYVSPCDFRESEDAPPKEGFIWAIGIEGEPRQFGSEVQRALYERLGKFLEDFDPYQMKYCVMDWVAGEPFVRSGHVFHAKDLADQELIQVRREARAILSDICQTQAA